jgi:uncharacterized iron-regulated membrane protein
MSFFQDRAVMPLSFSKVFTRAVWVKVHLYLALVMGLLFVLMGLTGSVGVYRDELDEWLNPQLVIQHDGQQMLSLDRVIAAVRAKEPERYGVWTLELPRTEHGALIAWFEKPKETIDEFYAPLMVAVNPYTGQVLDSRLWGRTFTTWVLDLHTQLRLEADGRKLVAWVAGFLMLSVGSGLCLWWPGWRQLPGAFAVHHNAGLMRGLFDLHRLLGLLSAPVLLLLAFTGFHLAYPPLLEALTASSGMGHGNDEGPNVHSSGVPSNKPVGLAEAVLVARGLFPSSEVRRISTPLGETGTYRINLRQRQEINQHHPVTTIWVDRWSGQIRDVRNPVKFSAGQRFSSWLWPLHTGEAFGDNGRLLWFVTGFMPLLLYISGICHWLYRRGVIADRPLDWVGWGNRLWRVVLGLHVGLAKKLEKYEPAVGLVIARTYNGLYAYWKKMKK